MTWFEKEGHECTYQDGNADLSVVVDYKKGKVSTLLQDFKGLYRSGRLGRELTVGMPHLREELHLWWQEGIFLWPLPTSSRP